MKYYSYHPVTKIFISEGIADESPLEPGIYLIPANATTVDVPEFSDTEFAVFNEESQSWSIVTEQKIEAVVEEAEQNHFQQIDLEEYHEVMEKKKNVLRKLGVSEEEVEEFFR
jgi:hypothetical protein